MNRYASRFFHSSLLLLTLFCTAAVQAQQLKLEIIPLKHRLLSDVLPIAQSLVIEGGTVTGLNDQLIIKSTAANIAEIKQVLGSLDTPPRRLMIFVKQDVNGNLNENESSFSGRLESGNVSAEIPDTGRSKEGLVVQGGDDDGNNVRFRSLSTRSDFDDRNTFQVQTIEGQPAFIQTGQSVPVASQQGFITGAGTVVVQNGVEYRDVTSGFYVIPRLSGDRVTLLIAPQLEKVNSRQGGVFDIQSVETTANGKLGEWIQIGGVTTQANEKNSRSLTRTRRSGQETRNVIIKVEELP